MHAAVAVGVEAREELLRDGRLEREAVERERALELGGREPVVRAAARVAEALPRAHEAHRPGFEPLRDARFDKPQRVYALIDPKDRPAGGRVLTDEATVTAAVLGGSAGPGGANPLDSPSLNSSARLQAEQQKRLLPPPP